MFFVWCSIPLLLLLLFLGIVQSCTFIFWQHRACGYTGRLRTKQHLRKTGSKQIGQQARVSPYDFDNVLAPVLFLFRKAHSLLISVALPSSAAKKCEKYSPRSLTASRRRRRLEGDGRTDNRPPPPRVGLAAARRRCSLLPPSRDSYKVPGTKKSGERRKNVGGGKGARERGSPQY